jgi:hypothetical protein
LSELLLDLLPGATQLVGDRSVIELGQPATGDGLRAELSAGVGHLLPARAFELVSILAVEPMVEAPGQDTGSPVPMWLVGPKRPAAGR